MDAFYRLVASYSESIFHRRRSGAKKYRGRYDIFTVATNGVLWMAIHPKDDKCSLVEDFEP